ncbi:hypothetical protein HN832_00090 [archaeon]|nr:hypothetical protein [archaeon]MBT4373643.1 hypothetical protein [archaeon]MBT4531697.1 hypothetical protein [archaeon]MBT7001809.1 hypothetical protein [archaeon]MBT7281794.1 hypothetical protein [archaeon]
MKNYEVCLQRLNEERDRVLEEVTKHLDDEEVRDVALLEAKCNYQTCLNFLGKLRKRGFPLNDDLSEDQDRYRLDAEYSGFINRFDGHLRRLKRVARDSLGGKIHIYLASNRSRELPFEKCRKYFIYGQ